MRRGARLPVPLTRPYVSAWQALEHLGLPGLIRQGERSLTDRRAFWLVGADLRQGQLHDGGDEPWQVRPIDGAR